MEIWFWAAVGGAVFAGISNFYFKVAASKGYDAEAFSFYGSVISLIIVFFLVILFPQPIFVGGWFSVLVFIGGLLAASNNISKVYALRHIDATIYYPLYKLLAPLLAIVAGVSLFSERFTLLEWGGMLLGLFVPLLLITKAENGRQNNLVAGLLLVLLTGVFSAGAAVLNKMGIDHGISTSVVLLYASCGILVGTVTTIAYKTGLSSLRKRIVKEISAGLIFSATMRAVFICASLGLMLYAFETGGSLAVVQTIYSLYILLPIVLAIIFYNEHWNTQKVIAIVLSVGALALLG